MTGTAFELEIGADGLAWLTFNLPKAKMNTLGHESMSSLSACLDRLQHEPSVKGLVIKSGKADNFIAGADVKEIRALQKNSSQDIFNASSRGKELFARIESLPYPVVAAINGVCLGGGTELALACKIRLASEEAKIGLPEVNLGFIPGWGGCVKLPRFIGLPGALKLILTGQVLDAHKAWKSGILCEVVKREELLPRARELALGARPKKKKRPFSELLSRFLLESNACGRKLIKDQARASVLAKTRGKYPAPLEALNVVVDGYSLPRPAAENLESLAFTRLAASIISQNLVGVFFAQQESKKLPALVGENAHITKIGVLGAGIMGAGIAQAAAKAGFQVIVKDVQPAFLDKGKAAIQALFAKLVSKGKLKRERADELLAAISYTTDYAAMKDCDLIIEAVVEDPEIKKIALLELEKTIERDFIFATNTSSLSVNDLAQAARRPEAICGIHFFNPVHKMPLVEIIKTNLTDDRTLAAAMSFAMRLDKTVVIAGDSPGFIVNRILAPYMREAVVLAEEGCVPEQIDKAMRSFGMPMGPLQLLDEVGLDVATKVMHVMHAAFGERLSPPECMHEIEKLKLLGKKSGKGIYLYSEKGKATGLNPDFLACLERAGKATGGIKMMPGQIQDRLLLLMINEAAQLLEEDVVEAPWQIDLAMIFGTGFAPFMGGVLKYADSQGLDIIVQKLEFLAAVNGDRYRPSRLLKEKAQAKESFYSPGSG